MIDRSRYLEQGYSARLFISLAVAALLIILAASQLPDEILRVTSGSPKKVLIEFIDLSAYFKNEPTGEGGGGGGGPARNQEQAPAVSSAVLPENLGIPVPVPMPDSSAASRLDIPTKESGLGVGTGEGSGIGSGAGSGIGNGIGNGIGDGIGDGSGGFVMPPRALIMAMPAYPSIDVKYKTAITIQLSVRVNQQGRVDSVIVLKNPTGLAAFENSARQAAFSSRYEPARSGDRAVVCWTKCDYTFSHQ